MTSGRLAPDHAAGNSDNEHAKERNSSKRPHAGAPRRQQRRGDRELRERQQRAERRRQPLRDTEAGHGGTGPTDIGELRRGREPEHRSEEETSAKQGGGHDLAVPPQEPNERSSNTQTHQPSRTFPGIREPFRSAPERTASLTATCASRTASRSITGCPPVPVGAGVRRPIDPAARSRRSKTPARTTSTNSYCCAARLRRTTERSSVVGTLQTSRPPDDGRS